MMALHFVHTYLSQMFRWLQNPWSFAVFPFLALGLKTFAPASCEVLGNFYPIYDGLCRFVMLPIVFINIILSIRNFIANGKKKNDILQTLSLFLAVSVLLFGIGCVISESLKFSHMLTHPESLYRLIIQSLDIKTIALDQPMDPVNSQTLFDLLTKNIPSNLFYALSSGRMLQIIFSAILLGYALCFIPTDMQTRFVHYSEIVCELFQSLSAKLLYLLSLGFFLVLCRSFSRVTDVTMLPSIWPFLVALLVLFAAVGGIALILISVALKKTVANTLVFLKNILALVFSTSEEFVAIPFFLKKVRKSQGIQGKTLDFVLPTGVGLFPFGYFLYFAIAAVTVDDIYGMPSEWDKWPVFFFLTLFSSIPKSETLTNILEPMGIPNEFASIFFPLIEPLTKPFCALLTFLVAAACTLWIARKPRLPRRSHKADDIPLMASSGPQDGR